MKKLFVWALGASLLLSSCATTSDGAYTGFSVGTILGSAIGGILGGPHGSDIGTLVGAAGGTAAGAAMGHANEKQAIHEHYDRVQQNKARSVESEYTPTDESGFDPTNAGDDRIDFAPSTSSNSHYAASPQVEIRNVRFEDAGKDGALRRGELGTVSFEVINRGSYPLDNLQPTVTETTGNKRITISAPIRVERLGPGEGIRYTATVRAGRVQDGTVTFVPTVCQGSATLAQAASVSVRTQR